MTGDQIAKILNLTYTGVQKCYREPDIYLFTDPHTKGTFAVKKLDREEVEKGLNSLRARFGV